jgi:hypothetical protein
VVSVVVVVVVVSPWSRWFWRRLDVGGGACRGVGHGPSVTAKFSHGFAANAAVGKTLEREGETGRASAREGETKFRN